MRLNKLIIISPLFYLLSIILVFLDSTFDLRWVSFFLWIMALILPVSFLQVKKEIRAKNYFIFLLLISIISHFIFLKEYPFVAIYDEVRDGGIHAMQIYNGVIANIFSYGRYTSHGLIIPTLTSFFYPIFKNDVLTYRIPSAILGTMDVILLFSLLRKFMGNNKAFLGSLTLLSLPLHLYYSRTEIVVIFSSLLTTFILLLLFNYLKNKDKTKLIFLATTIGFSLNFHASIRTISVFTALLTIGLILKEKRLKELLIFILFIIIGFGPRILFTNYEIFFQVHSITPSNNYSFFTLIQNYFQSLKIYFISPTLSTHYPDFKPLLNIIYGFLFTVGSLSLLLSRKTYSKILLFFALLIPFTNSALTNSINADHRLAPLFPISAIIIAFGINRISETLKKLVKLKLLLFIFLFGFALAQVFLFFKNEPANKKYDSEDYLNMHLIYQLKDDKSFSNVEKFCIYTSVRNFEKYKLWNKQLEREEQYQFFLPSSSTYLVKNEKIKDNELYASISCEGIDNESFTRIKVCEQRSKFTCRNDIYTLFVGKSDKRAKELPENYIYFSNIPKFVP